MVIMLQRGKRRNEILDMYQNVTWFQQSLVVVVGGFFTTTLFGGLCLLGPEVNSRKKIEEAHSRQPRTPSPPRRAPCPWQPYQGRAGWNINAYTEPSADVFTFFSSSSSSFHLAPRSLPTSPVNTVENRYTRNRDRLTEPSIRILSLDSLSPVLAEEHVGREGSLRPPLAL